MVKGVWVKAGLSRERVLDGALEYLDAHGLPALSMRKLGTHLGVEAMSLYRHVPNKAALLDGLVDRVMELAFAGLQDPPPGRTGAWVPWMRQFAHALRAALRAHPGVLPLAATRPVNSPDALRMSERWLATMRAAGLPLGRAMDVVNVVATFTIGHTLAEVGQTPGHEGTEPDLDQRADELDPALFPNLAEVIATRAGLDFDSRFAEAIDILLAGYAALPLKEAP
ncbi:TetR/AcrR family transcriptional regulator C-terminal domain-containing protein [Dactylosporangium aurantiacum]|uniref:TetR/AcrR family transcriptional regulator C-terminal domain-containing protein n=1 Tax=Dactylosporangium aurantiacum TaxID=35754 RepID=A0A9Q9MN93_9ACTN|nr:TetR/AcrR family transcriptional regulator C-terminal domain-containing protein [Dactylosporangium aurantiacum]MDG6103732.1 TetR/AcrR family transcriptional regulator C-terminal domain-containing protein [Dactylosporangium aurantiacum]UWZ59051.1 TetR/AcrR family transcriptional regulator C-terminal domain-containing protein [Dactylosporangium aurantiacum]